MNTTIESNPLNSRGSRCAAVLLAAAALACCVAGVVPSTRAQEHQVPFKATFDAEGSAVMTPPLVEITIHGQGIASHMGWTSMVTTNQLLNLITLHATATYTLTAANGDTVVLAVEVDYVILPAAEGVTFSGDYVVVGGTGRFESATGGGTITAQATFTGPDTSIALISLEGTISVLSLPITVRVDRQGSSLALSWIGGTGPYRVQKATNLTLADWQDYLTNAQSPLTLETHDPIGFYRVVEP